MIYISKCICGKSGGIFVYVSKIRGVYICNYEKVRGHEPPDQSLDPPVLLAYKFRN